MTMEADRNNPNVNQETANPASDNHGTTNNAAPAQVVDNASEKPVNTVSLYLPGLNEPLVITGKDSITFGRRDAQNNIIPTVDLSTNYGALLGVSRMHAEILFKEDGCFIEDLNSSNGTWVNERKIDPHEPSPLRNGDQVRLGQLLMIVYMSSLQQPARNPSTTKISENTLHLVDPTQLHDKLGFSPTYLKTVVTPLTEAIEKINSLLIDSSQPLLVTYVAYDKNVSEMRIGITQSGSKLVNYLHNRLPELMEQMSSGATAPLLSQLDMVVQDMKRTLNPNADEPALREAVNALLMSRLRFITDDNSLGIE